MHGHRAFYIAGNVQGGLLPCRLIGDTIAAELGILGSDIIKPIPSAPAKFVAQ